MEENIYSPDPLMIQENLEDWVITKVDDWRESNVAELEEATFGRGKWFDITDDLNDSERQDIQYLRTKLMEDFANTKIRKSVAECLLNAAVFGTGIAEICLEEMWLR